MEEHLSFTMHQFLNAPHRLASVQDETVRTYEKLMQVSCDVVACQQQLDTVATRDEHRASQQWTKKTVYVEIITEQIEPIKNKFTQELIATQHGKCSKCLYQYIL